ncbi:hypothetical protein E0L93_05610 [Rubrobacter taiwanensis]|jgi:hypothetical protein|uniref:Uncharacterized protein n=1 Tax=Rubrobacter taiwanensis TaxID=185139 RepID=A0A4R1BMA0_9ACTN|nr:hypothetical protein [Rubrobacter taiwanensis]TCJ18467.1 hypothetical protein E0L93_05610 [Rubrobacter taiwanensis]
MIFFHAAVALFVVNFALGVAVQLRWVDTERFRWLHHALFFLVFAFAALAVFFGFLWQLPYRWALVPVLALFAVLPRVRAGTAGHAGLAGCALAFYVLGLAMTLREGL